MAHAQLTLSDVNLLDHDLFAEREPWDVFDLLQREAPVFWHAEPAGPGFWAVTKYEDVLVVLKDWETFSSEKGGSATIETLPEDVLEARRNFMETDPPRHSQFRKIFAADFTPRAVRRYAPWLHELVTEVLDEVLGPDMSGPYMGDGDRPADMGEGDRPAGVGEGDRTGPHEESAETAGSGFAEFEAVHEVAAPIPIRVLGRILGVSDEHLPRLVELGDKLLVDTEPDYVGERAFEGEREEDRYLPFGSPWAEELCALGRQYYGERREQPEEDVLSLIANAELDGCPLSGPDLDNTFAILVVAGNETTRQAIASGLLAFARNPDQWQLLRSDPSLVPTAVEEVLRYSHPVWHFRRTATRDTELRGTRIRAGDKVVVWYGAANHDPDTFPDPHRFDVRREPNEHATFGRYGPHFCLGAHLARLELTVLLEELVPRVEAIELAGEPKRLRSNFTNGLKHLPLRVELATGV